MRAQDVLTGLFLADAPRTSSPVTPFPSKHLSGKGQCSWSKDLSPNTASISQLLSVMADNLGLLIGSVIQAQILSVGRDYVRATSAARRARGSAANAANAAGTSSIAAVSTCGNAATTPSVLVDPGVGAIATRHCVKLGVG
jgi:hypothetical protein